MLDTDQTTNPTAPDWVVPGAKVLTVHGHRSDWVTETTIHKVHKRYFTVNGSDLRFSLDRQTNRAAGVWSAPTRVIPRDSPEGMELLRAGRRRRLIDAADDRFHTWRTTRTQDNLLAAIGALQAVADEGNDHG